MLDLQYHLFLLNVHVVACDSLISILKLMVENLAVDNIHIDYLNYFDTLIH